MTTIPLLTALLAVGTWLGAMIFLSAVLAPMVFKVLSVEGASLFLRNLFPRYYKFGIGCGVVLLMALLMLVPVSTEFSATLLWSTVGAIVIIILGVYSLILIPRINAARDAGSSMRQTFNHLHLRSVVLNCINIIVTLFVLVNLTNLFT